MKDDSYAVLWSGGKDSCLALWRTMEAGLHVTALLNFIDESSNRVRFHAVRSALIAEQAHRLRLELLQFPTAPESFADSFEAALRTINARGYAGVVAGDIHLEDVRKWNEDQAAAAGLRCVEPLWREAGLDILRSFVEAGFRAVLTCCDERWKNVLWPGREINSDFISDVSDVVDLDPCGERGEYHSFVFAGPLFSSPVIWVPGEIRRSNGFSQIDLMPEQRLTQALS